MAENITGKFNSLSDAEAAATKLKSIRARDVEISEWNGAQGIDDDLESYSNMRAAFLPTSWTYYPLGGGLTSPFYNMAPYGASGEVGRFGNYSQSYLVNGIIAEEERDKAVRIIRECGGSEI